MESKLVGYIRKSNDGKALKMSLDVDALEAAERYEAQGGREYISLIANLEKVEEIIEGDREVTSLCYFVDE